MSVDSAHFKLVKGNGTRLRRDGVSILFENSVAFDLHEWGWIFEDVSKGDADAYFYNRGGDLRWANVLGIQNREFPRATGAVQHPLENPGPFIVVGHSYGALLAVAYAAVLRLKIVGLVLIDPVLPGQLTTSDRELQRYLWLRQRLFNRQLRSYVEEYLAPHEWARLVSLPPDSARRSGQAFMRSSTWKRAREDVRSALHSWDPIARGPVDPDILLHVAIPSALAVTDPYHFLQIKAFMEKFNRGTLHILSENVESNFLSSKSISAQIGEIISVTVHSVQPRENQIK